MAGTGRFRFLLAAQSPIQSVSTEKIGLQGLGPREADMEIHGNYLETFMGINGDIVNLPCVHFGSINLRADDLIWFKE